jgi:endonuclease I
MKKRSVRRRVSFALIALSILPPSRQAAEAAQYDPPVNYYNTATGTGSTLKTQLRTIISVMDGVTYGDARYSTPYTDPDPNVPGNILLIYNRASLDGDWDNVNLPWNREHIWPESRLGASASNGTANIASDQFNLRPCDTDINANRGNSPFGNDTATGNYGYVGSNWYPSDADAGDVARAQFYMATRYSTLSLVDSNPSGTQMGDLSSLINFHFRDVPDSFERRRNHAIYGLAGDGAPAITNPYRQENRNPFVDHPEWVWSVFVDQQNDSQLYVGGAPGADGGSNHNLNLGSVIVGGSVPAAQNVTLTKAGLDGTYYEVATSGLATSSVLGRLNAFPVITSGTSSKVLTVGLNTNTSTAGQKTGTVTVNNLDITTAGGAGRGANDGNDTINVSLDVLAHANPSFSLASDENSLSYDFGTVTLGASVPAIDFDIANLASVAGYTAKLDLDSIVSAGDFAKFDTDLAAFTGANALAAGESSFFFATIDTSTEGVFTASYTLNFSDENLSGAANLGSLTLNLTGTVEAAVIETADFDGDGDVDGRDFFTWQRGYSLIATATRGDGDANDDGTVDEADLLIWQEQYGQQAGSIAATGNVPEPSALLMGFVILSIAAIRRIAGTSDASNRG